MECERRIATFALHDPISPRGASAPPDTHADIPGSARYTESVGLDCLWAGDHLAVRSVPLLDPMLVLAAVATATERGRRTDAFLQALPDLLAGRRATVPSYDGPVGVQLAPAVAPPVVWVGGSSRRALNRVVRFGDGWLAGLVTADEFARAARLLRELADDAGRPTPRLGLVAHAMISDDDHAREVAISVLRSAYGLSVEPWRRSCDGLAAACA